MEKKNYLLGVKKDKNGKCEKVFQVSNYSQNEYGSLLNEEAENEKVSLEEKQELLNTIADLKQKVAYLEREIRYLKGEEDDEEENN